MQVFRTGFVDLMHPLHHLLLPLLLLLLPLLLDLLLLLMLLPLPLLLWRRLPEVCLGSSGIAASSRPSYSWKASAAGTPRVNEHRCHTVSLCMGFGTPLFKEATSQYSSISVSLTSDPMGRKRKRVVGERARANELETITAISRLPSTLPEAWLGCCAMVVGTGKASRAMRCEEGAKDKEMDSESDTQILLGQAGMV